jgi:hypothetical protein
MNCAPGFLTIWKTFGFMDDDAFFDHSTSCCEGCGKVEVDCERADEASE